MNLTLDSQNRPMVSILNEKRLDRPLPGTLRLVAKTSYYKRFFGICNGFLSFDPLFLRLLSLISQAARQLAAATCKSGPVISLGILLPPQTELSSMMVCHKTTFDCHGR